MKKQIMRYMVQYFMMFPPVSTSGSETYELLGEGWTKFDESPNPQAESVTYIHEKLASPAITRYEPSFAFELQQFSEDPTIAKVYEIAKNRLTGNDAVVTIVATDWLVDEDGNLITTVVKARKIQCAVEVTDMVTGAGGEILTMSGNFNQRGEEKHGWFNIATKTWSDTEPQSGGGSPEGGSPEGH